ncbi:MAG: hypothetical protein AABX38_04595 [Candidatus Micrarchaeota archaeon]
MPALIKQPSRGSGTRNCSAIHTDLAVAKQNDKSFFKGKNSLSDSLPSRTSYSAPKTVKTEFTALPTEKVYAQYATWNYKFARPGGQARFSRSRSRKVKMRALRVKKTLVKQRASSILLDQQATKVRHILNNHSNRDQKALRSVLGIQNTRQTAVRTQTLLQRQKKAQIAQARAIEKIEDQIRRQSVKAGSVAISKSCVPNAQTRPAGIRLTTYTAGRTSSTYSVHGKSGFSSSTFMGTRGGRVGVQTHTSSGQSAKLVVAKANPSTSKTNQSTSKTNFKADIATTKLVYDLSRTSAKANVVDTRDARVFKPFGTNSISTSPNGTSKENSIMAGKFIISNPTKVGSFLFTGLVGSKFTAATAKAAAANSSYSPKSSSGKFTPTPTAAIIGAPDKVRRYGKMTGTSAMPEEPKV